jgi:hypothetical protein
MRLVSIVLSWLICIAVNTIAAQDYVADTNTFTIEKRAPMLAVRFAVFSFFYPVTPNMQLQIEKSISNHSSINFAYGYIYGSLSSNVHNIKGSVGKLALRNYYSEKNNDFYVAVEMLYKNFSYVKNAYLGYNCIGENGPCDYYKAENFNFRNQRISVLGTWGMQNFFAEGGKMALDLSFSAGALYSHTSFINYIPKENTFANFKDYKRASTGIGEIGLNILINLNIGLIEKQK